MAVAIIQLLLIATLTITLVITGITGTDIRIDQQHTHIDRMEVINQVEAVINQLEDQVQGRELVVQELAVQEDANNDRKIKK